MRAGCYNLRIILYMSVHESVCHLWLVPAVHDVTYGNGQQDHSLSYVLSTGVDGYIAILYLLFVCNNVSGIICAHMDLYLFSYLSLSYISMSLSIYLSICLDYGYYMIIYVYIHSYHFGFDNLTSRWTPEQRGLISGASSPPQLHYFKDRVFLTHALTPPLP